MPDLGLSFSYDRAHWIFPESNSQATPQEDESSSEKQQRVKDNSDPAVQGGGDVWCTSQLFVRPDKRICLGVLQGQAEQDGCCRSLTPPEGSLRWHLSV